MTSYYEQYVEQIENSSASSDAINAAVDALGFTQAFHEFMTDWGMMKSTSDEVDVAELEAAFESFIGEFQAACIFLASLNSSDKLITAAYNKLKSTEDSGVPSSVINGYKKLADRVKKTRKSLEG